MELGEVEEVASHHTSGDSRPLPPAVLGDTCFQSLTPSSLGECCEMAQPAGQVSPGHNSTSLSTLVSPVLCARGLEGIRKM